MGRLPCDSRLLLRDLGTLLPYRSHVDPASVVGALNALIDDVRGGRTVFYNIYTGQQKAEEAERANTGLFFFRGRAGAPFAVIAPGGGFVYVGSIHEGFPYAVAIRDRATTLSSLKSTRRVRWRTGNARPGRRSLLYLPQRQRVGREHEGLFPVGQLGGRTHGGCDWFTRGRALRR